MTIVKPEKVIVDWLLDDTRTANADLLALVGRRIWANDDWPEGWSPQGSNPALEGPSVLLKVLPSTLNYSGVIWEANVQFRSAAHTGDKARNVDLALFEAVNRQTGAGITFVTDISLGQSSPVQEIGIEEYLSIWLFRIRMT